MLETTNVEPVVRPCHDAAATFRDKLPARLLRTADAARYLAVSQWTMRRLAYANEIPVIPGKFLRFDVQDLDRYIAANKGGY
jgi:excisionase family DNA binding protein